MQTIKEKFFELYNIPKMPISEGYDRLREYDKIEFKHEYPKIDEHKLLQLICISKTISNNQKGMSYVPKIEDLEIEVLQNLSDWYINNTDEQTYKLVRRIFHV